MKRIISTFALALTNLMNPATAQAMDYLYFNDIYSTRPAGISLPSTSAITMVGNDIRMGSSYLTISWLNVGAEAYWLDVGTSLGEGNIFARQTNIESTVAVVNLSVLESSKYSEKIFIRLWTKRNGAWLAPRDISFANPIYTAPVAAQILGAARKGTDKLIVDWADVGAESYYVDFGTSLGEGNLKSESTNFAGSVAVIPNDGRPVYVRIWSKFNGRYLPPVDKVFNLPRMEPYECYGDKNCSAGVIIPIK